MNGLKICLFLSIGQFLITSCANDNPQEAVDDVIKNENVDYSQIIKIEELSERTPFIIEIQTRGLLRPFQKYSVKTKTAGKIINLPIQEGQFIKNKAILLQQEKDFLELNLQQLQNDLEEAIFKKNELLIQFGGELGIDTSVSPLVLKTINIKSGFNRILQSIKQTEYEISQTTIEAPFTGIISDVKVKQFQYLNIGEDICNLINPYSFEVEFLLMENEALKIKMGQSINIIPTAIQEMNLRADVVRINPVVNEQGLVKLYAKIKGKERLKFFEGMNVRVLIENRIPNQLIISKEALILRSGREVVFTYDENEKRAKWNYVKVAYENDTHLAISEGLKPGDKVIVHGNNNLVHDSEVVLETEESVKLEAQQ